MQVEAPGPDIGGRAPGHPPKILAHTGHSLQLPAWRRIDPDVEARIFRLVRALGAEIVNDAGQPVLPSWRARV